MKTSSNFPFFFLFLAFLLLMLFLLIPLDASAADYSDADSEPFYENQQIDYTDKLDEVLDKLSAISVCLENLPSDYSEGQAQGQTDYTDSFNEVLHELSDIANALADISTNQAAVLPDTQTLTPDPEPTEYQRELLNYIIDITNRLELLAPEPADPEQQAIADQEQKEQLENESEERQEFKEILTSIRDSLVILSTPAEPEELPEEQPSEDSTEEQSSEPEPEQPEEQPSDTEPEQPEAQSSDSELEQPEEQPSDPAPEQPEEPTGEQPPENPEAEQLPEISDQEYRYQVLALLRMIAGALILICAWPILRLFYRFISSFFPV